MGFFFAIGPWSGAARSFLLWPLLLLGCVQQGKQATVHRGRCCQKSPDLTGAQPTKPVELQGCASDLLCKSRLYGDRLTQPARCLPRAFSTGFREWKLDSCGHAKLLPGCVGGRLLLPLAVSGTKPPPLHSGFRVLPSYFSPTLWALILLGMFVGFSCHTEAGDLLSHLPMRDVERL